MKILITGVCGFVGHTLAKTWIESESSLTIYGMDNLSRSGSEINRNLLQRLGVKLFHGDIRMASDFEALPPVDWVIDASANPSIVAGCDGHTSSRQLIEHNLLGTVNILEYCKRVNAGFILLSTSRVYSIAALSALPVEQDSDSYKLSRKLPLIAGVSAKGISETFSTLAPISLYGCTKLASETIALEYGESFGFPVWINRCGVMAGAGQFGRADQGIFAYWINSWLRLKPLTYLGFGGNGYQVRDCLHPHDLTALLKKQMAVNSKILTRVINVGGGNSHAISLAQLSSWCSDRFGFCAVNSEPESRMFDIPWLVMDSTQALDIWGWHPETALNDILEEIAWHAEQNPDWLELSGSL